jgi:uncharacterized paraquat-inducible protein A
MSHLLQCTKCGNALLEEDVGKGGRAFCSKCGGKLDVTLFPAYHRGLKTSAPGDSVVSDEQASCFYHPGKLASTVCGSCGRFICDLCKLEFKGSPICPTCLETGERKHAIEDLEKGRVRYDNIALALTVIPLFAWPISFVTAPLAAGVIVRYWRSPSSLVAGTRSRMLVAALLAVLQIGGWGLFLASWLRT